MFRIKNIYTLFFVLMTFCSFSQEEEYEEPDEYRFIQPKHSYSIDFSLPVSVTNKAFKGMMQGLVRAGADYQFNLKNGLALGLGYKYTFFQINKFKTPQQVNGGLHIHSPHINLGWDKFFNERAGIELHTKIGYSNFTFYSDSLERLNGNKNLSIACTYIEPSFAFVLTASKYTAYKWTIAYSFQNMGFSPTQIGILANGGYDPNKFKRHVQFLSFGFAFVHYFKQR
jgi:Ca2+/Na+ antiporter